MLRRIVLCGAGILVTALLFGAVMSIAGYLTNTARVTQAVEQTGYSNVKPVARYSVLPFMHGCGFMDNVAFDIEAVKTDELAASIKFQWDRINHHQQLQNAKLIVENDELDVDIAKLKGREPDYRKLNLDRETLALTESMVNSENSPLFAGLNSPPKVHHLIACVGFFKSVKVSSPPSNSLAPE